MKKTLGTRVAQAAKSKIAAAADARGDMVAVLPAQGPHPSLGHHADLFRRFVGAWDADYSFIAQDGSGPGGPWAAARVHPACAAVRRA